MAGENATTVKGHRKPGKLLLKGFGNQVNGYFCPPNEQRMPDDLKPEQLPEETSETTSEVNAEVALDDEVVAFATEDEVVAPLAWDKVHSNLTNLLARLESAIAREDSIAAADDVSAHKEALLHALEQLDDADLDEEQNTELKRIANQAKSHAGDFDHKLEQHHAAIAKAHHEHLEKRKAIISEIQSLIVTEQRIGPAFRRFRDLQEVWKKAGEVAHNEYRALQTAYNYEVDRFYYTINIYKDLRDLDLQRNLEVRLDLIEKMKMLLEEKGIRKQEMLVKALQEEWSEAGPVGHERWEELKLAFYDAMHKVYDKIHLHYDQVRQHHEQNLEAKRRVLQKAIQLSELDLRHPKKWSDKTIQLKTLQDEWRTTGMVSKQHGEAIWQEFRNACDRFFERKRAFFAEWKAEATKGRVEKLTLIEKVEAWKDSEDWKEATRAIIDIQKQWKDTAPAGPADKELWDRFRGICDSFFQRKKEHFNTLDERQAANELKKRTILEEMAAFDIGMAKGEAIARLKQLPKHWREAGMVPRAVKQELDNAFNKALDRLYGQLKVGKANKAEAQYEGRLEMMCELPDARQQLQDERKHLRMLLGKAQTACTQYEHNMGFIKNPNSKSPLLMDLHQKLDRVKSDIEGLTAKIGMIDKAIKGL